MHGHNTHASTSTVDLMSALWRNDKSVKVWKIPKPCDVFRAKYDSIQENLQNISCMDDLLSGMFSILIFRCIFLAWINYVYGKRLNYTLYKDAYTIVSWVSAHGRSTITPYFLPPWALTRCTGHLPCAKLCTKLVGGVNTQSQSQWWLDLDRR